MEQEKRAKEQEEREKAEKEKKLKEGYGIDESSKQWEKDKNVISSMAKEKKEDAEELKSGSADPAAKPQQSNPAKEADTPSSPQGKDTRKKSP